jgi:hypothetical protein
MDSQKNTPKPCHRSAGKSKREKLLLKPTVLREGFVKNQPPFDKVIISIYHGPSYHPSIRFAKLYMVAPLNPFIRGGTSC